MNSKVSKHILAYYVLYFIGGGLYVLLEYLWRGRSHYTMFILGGLCFVAVGSINEISKKELSLVVQGLIGSAIITTLEFITGCIVNLMLHWNVWDYSNVFCNILGQVCLPYSCLWVLLAIVCVILNDALLVFFDIRDSMPKYRII